MQLRVLHDNSYCQLKKTEAQKSTTFHNDCFKILELNLKFNIAKSIVSANQVE